MNILYRPVVFHGVADGLCLVNCRWSWDAQLVLGAMAPLYTKIALSARQISLFAVEITPIWHRIANMARFWTLLPGGN